MPKTRKQIRKRVEEQAKIKIQNPRHLPEHSTNEMLDKVQKLYDRDPKSFLLVKIGANDGWMCDNLYDFVIKNDPNCVMVEPIPCYFNALKKTFTELKNVRYEQIAIDVEEGTREMTYISDAKFQNEEITFRLSHTPHLLKEHWARGLGSFYKDKNNLGCPELAQHAETIKVKTMNINNLLEKYNASNANLIIATDCEGHDYEILKSFDFETYKPFMYICEIVLLTRYPLSHPRRKDFIDDEKTPGKRLPPPTEEGWEHQIEIEITEEQYKILSELPPEQGAKVVKEMLAAGQATDRGYGYAGTTDPNNMEFLQEDGLYTIKEVQESIKIFNAAGYHVIDNSEDGDIFAITNEYLKEYQEDLQHNTSMNPHFLAKRTFSQEDLQHGVLATEQERPHKGNKK